MSNFCPEIQFWQNSNIFTSFSPKFFLIIFLVKSKLSTAKKSKTTTFSRVFHPKKSTIFSGNQSWIFGQKMKISNSVWWWRHKTYLPKAFTGGINLRVLIPSCSTSFSYFNLSVRHMRSMKMSNSRSLVNPGGKVVLSCPLTRSHSDPFFHHPVVFPLYLVTIPFMLRSLTPVTLFDSLSPRASMDSSDSSSRKIWEAN